MFLMSLGKSLQGDLRRRNGGGGGSSDHQRNEEHIMFPKPETLDFDLPCDTSYPQQIGVC